MLNHLLGNPLVMMALVLIILVFPVWRILNRTGHSGLWSLLMFISLVNFVALWIFAFVSWPAVDRKT
jgi:predicted PurR-regulated permease PerM